MMDCKQMKLNQTNQMTITPTQIEKLARDHATDFAEKVDIQFLMEFYIENYINAVVLEDVVDDIFCHTNNDIDATQEFMIESGISPEDALIVLKDFTNTSGSTDALVPVVQPSITSPKAPFAVL